MRVGIDIPLVDDLPESVGLSCSRMTRLMAKMASAIPRHVPVSGSTVQMNQLTFGLQIRIAKMPTTHIRANPENTTEHADEVLKFDMSRWSTAASLPVRAAAPESSPAVTTAVTGNITRRNSSLLVDMLIFFSLSI
jgi:hypothetical protein